MAKQHCCVPHVTDSKYAATKLLIEQDIPLDSADSDHRTALIHASRNDHYDVAKLLIEKGALLLPVDGDGLTAFASAAQHGHTAIAMLLI